MLASPSGNRLSYARRPELPFSGVAVVAGVSAQLVDVVDGKRRCERRPHPGRVQGRQRSLRSAGVETAGWGLSLALVDFLASWLSCRRGRLKPTFNHGTAERERRGFRVRRAEGGRAKRGQSGA